MNQTKICYKCHKEKSINDFSKNKTHKDSHQNECKLCFKVYKNTYNKTEKRKKSDKKWLLKNPKYQKEYHKRYRLENKDELRIKSNNYVKQRLKVDSLFKIIKNYRHRINISLKAQGVKKSLHTIDYLGCTSLEHQNHLKSHFLPDMLLENTGPRKWVQHHVISFDSVDLSDPEQLKKVCHYTNIVPMWADEHKEFHKKYGFKTNKEQYDEFMKEKYNG